MLNEAVALQHFFIVPSSCALNAASCQEKYFLAVHFLVIESGDDFRCSASRISPGDALQLQKLCSNFEESPQSVESCASIYDLLCSGLCEYNRAFGNNRYQRAEVRW